MSTTEAAQVPVINNTKEEPKKEEVKENNENKCKGNEDKNQKKEEKPAPKESNATAVKLPSFQEKFKAFSKFGDTKSDGKHITLSQSDKWMKQAGVIDGKKITTTDTGIYFKRFKQQKIGYADYGKFLEKLAEVKKAEVTEIKTKMRSCGDPGLVGTTTVVKSSAVERLADTPKKKDDTPPKGKSVPKTMKSPTAT